MSGGGNSDVRFADGDLRRRVEHTLGQHHYPALLQIEVEADDGIVILEGRLATFYEKQVCLSLCQRVAGVKRVIDHIEVPAAHLAPPADEI